MPGHAPITVSPEHRLKTCRRVVLALLGCTALPGGTVMPAFCQASSPGGDITQLSLEQLSQAHISVSSFGRKEEDLWKTPAAVFVITRKQIEESGASCIPELLRTVPGVQVSQINAAVWAISVRGFNSANSNKLLVLVDGRSVYTEVFSGTQWDQIDLPLDNIERIEVIRGPGAVAWGANAVNGVINIITRHARATQGLLLAGSSSRIEQTGVARWGATRGDRIQYTGFAQYVNRWPLLTASGAPAFDGEQTFRVGGVADFRQSAVNSFTLDGDLYGGRLKQQILSSINVDVGPGHREHETLSGGHLLSRWEHTSLNASELALQVYFDDQSRHQLANDIRTRSFSADLQDHLPARAGNDIVFGAQLRLSFDHFRGDVLINQRPEYTNYLLEGFVQDEIALLPNRLSLTLGSKIENGTLAGFQLQPSVRAIFTFSPAQSLWVAVSRAVVAPSLQDTQLAIPIQLENLGGLPHFGQFLGDPQYLPERVIAYEAGSRTRLKNALSLDLAAFYNSNNRVQSLSIGSPVFVAGTQPSLFSTLLYTNGFTARSGGVEASLAWKPRSNLSLRTSYAWLQSHSTPILPGLVFLVDGWNTPRHTFSQSVSWALGPHWNAAGFFNFVGCLPPSTGVLSDPTQGDSSSYTPAYNRLDLHLSRKLPHSFEIEAGGTNLIAGSHLEIGSSSYYGLPTYIPRSASFKVDWSY